MSAAILDNVSKFVVVVFIFLGFLFTVDDANKDRQPIVVGFEILPCKQSPT